MQESRLEFATTKSVAECASTFSSAVKASYGAARKLLRGVAVIRGGNSGGVEFFTPDAGPFSSVGRPPDWQAGVWIPGYNKMHGASRMAVHIYVVDHGDQREVQLVGPYGLGEKGSTDRLLKNIAAHF